jgi:hypothetical protein
MSNTQSIFHCPQCRATISNLLPDAKIAGCAACGTVSMVETDGSLRRHLVFQPLPKDYQNPFEVGDPIDYQGLRYIVYAIYCYTVKYEEFDKEDSKWVAGGGFNVEWYARSSNKSEITVVSETDDKFYMLSNAKRMTFSDSYLQQEAIEIGEYNLMGFVGTDSDDALEVKGFYRAFSGGYSVESQKEVFVNNNFKAFHSNYITPTQLKRMVVIDRAEKEAAEERFANVNFYRKVFGWAFLLIFALFFINGAMNTEGGQKGDEVQFKEQLFNSEYANGGIDTANLHPKSVGIFDLKAGQNYNFKAKSYISGTNRDADFSVSIVKPDDGTTVSEVGIAFFTESGSDSDGAWTENLLQDEFKFQVAQSGKYEVFIAPDYDDLATMPASTINITIEKTPYFFFYLILGSAFLLLFLIFQWQRENIVAYANLPHGTILHDVVESFG